MKKLKQWKNKLKRINLGRGARIVVIGITVVLLAAAIIFVFFV